jgi:hypothetical protein
MERNFSKKFILSVLFIYSMIIFFVYFELFGKAIKILNQKLINKNFCAIGNTFNDDIIELLTTATKLCIKLIIIEPQRLVQYLSEEELVLFRKSDNSSVFETSFSPNKIILGVFETDLNSSQTVRHSIIDCKILLHLKSLLKLKLYFLSLNFF